MIHQYQLGGYNIVLDVCSGSVHVVDEVAYDISGMYETSTRAEICAAMLEKYGGGNRAAEKSDPTLVTGHASMVENMLDAVINHTDPQILPLEAIKSVRIVNAVYESARTGKTVYFD